uniref:DUF7151 family protein n=1 Tax=Thaumasiovibrio occultus TaxID=1891184 RepID=UPI000B363066|nr:vWA domain-containing protein [Thaumasiovibrio occultus]
MTRLLNKTLLATAVSAVLLTACNNSNGDAPKEPQKDALVVVQDLPKGDADCPQGGIKIQAGYDNDNSGILEDSEFVSNRTVCNDNTGQTSDEGEEIFNKALVTISLIAKEDARCDIGGQEVTIGIDKNSNSILDDDEITNTEVLCSTGDVDFTPAPIINAININPTTVPVGATTQISATISNLGPSDIVTWKDSAGNILSPDNSNDPHIITVQVGYTPGQETYTLTVETTNDQGVSTTQQKTIVVAVEEAQATPTQAISLNSKQVFLPQGYSISELTGDVYGSLIYAENITPRSSIATPAGTELLGFVAERTNLATGLTTESVLNSTVSSVMSALRGNAVQTSQTVLANGNISASYNITLDTASQITQVLQATIEQAAINTIGGSISALVPAAAETPATDFQFDITVNYDSNSGHAVVTTTLVDKSNVAKYEDLIKSTSSDSLAASTTATLVLHNDSFQAVNQTASKADFLFVIDNSGSMAGEQTAISELTEVFTQTIQNAGVDYMVGAITTDSDELRGVGFTKDIIQIADDLKPGIGGSPLERGIYYSEKALSTGGTVDVAGYPRPDASLSVVIMSDEKSQYLGKFDPNNNLFIDSGYRVYAIVNPSDAYRSQYDDLAVATLGKTLNINVTSEYRSFVETMAENAGASAAGYKLTKANSNQILSSSLAVSVNGTPASRDSLNGWQYYPLSQSIVFTGNAIPAEGAFITVAYQYVDDSQPQ